jgi:hypothetical protein
VVEQLAWQDLLCGEVFEIFEVALLQSILLVVEKEHERREGKSCKQGLTWISSRLCPFQRKQAMNFFWNTCGTSQH